jgi:hypothetical protein
VRDRLVHQIERTIEAAIRTVAEQEKRVARQRARIEELERQQHPELAEDARGILRLLEEFLERNKQELADSEERRAARLSQSTEPNSGRDVGSSRES